jgi:hypothetical protein
MVRAARVTECSERLLRAPFERQLDVPGECFCRKTDRLPALHDGLNNNRRQTQADQAANIAHGEPLTCSDLGQRSRLSGADLVEPPMCPGDSISNPPGPWLWSLVVFSLPAPPPEFRRANAFRAVHRSVQKTDGPIGRTDGALCETVG